jgi:hypothetical protein
MDRIVQEVVAERLRRLYSAVSERRRVTIDLHVRSFIDNLVFESLSVRGNEWQARTELDPDKSWASEDIASQVDKAVRSVGFFHLLRGREPIGDAPPHRKHAAKTRNPN